MEQVTTWWQVLIAVIGALGGLECVKWFFNRKTNSRIALAEAESAEFHHLQETNEWLQKQMQAKEERFAEQTQLVRKQNTEILELTAKMAESDIAHTREIAELKIELVKVRCDDESCPFRKPPNATTPPKHGISRDQYHKGRENKSELQPQTTE